MQLFIRKSLILLISLCFTSFSALAAIEIASFDTPQGTTKVAIGGYAKVDVRHVNGDIAYQDYWVANFPGGEPIETSHTGFNVRESRLNFKVSHGEVYGFVELDMYGGGGNEVISNSSNPRLRMFYINYKNWRIGQDWSTFMPFAVGLTGAEADPDESIPDFVARYNHSADWGVVSAAALFRMIDPGGLEKSAVSVNIAGKINTYGNDDFRFQVTMGDPGRYVAAGLSPDIVIDPQTDETVIESTTAFAVSYRHFWTETLRSTAFFGAAETDVLGRKRAHWGINIIDNLTDHLHVGVELGNYAINDDSIADIDSNYLQFSAKYRQISNAKVSQRCLSERI